MYLLSILLARLFTSFFRRLNKALKRRNGELVGITLNNNEHQNLRIRPQFDVILRSIRREVADVHPFEHYVCSIMDCPVGPILVGEVII